MLPQDDILQEQCDRVVHRALVGANVRAFEGTGTLRHWFRAPEHTRALIYRALIRAHTLTHVCIYRALVRAHTRIHLHTQDWEYVIDKGRRRQGPLYWRRQGPLQWPRQGQWPLVWRKQGPLQWPRQRPSDWCVLGDSCNLWDLCWPRDLLAVSLAPPP